MTHALEHLAASFAAQSLADNYWLLRQCSYQPRSTRSHHLPGALVDDMTFTL